MSLLLESIRYENGQFYNLKLHEARMERALKKEFKIDKRIQLKKEIRVPKGLKKGRYKCRLVYDTKIQEVEFSLYKRKKISSIKLIEDDTISYSHKYADRSCITDYTKKMKPGEEIIFVKKGLLRDASYSNIALFNGSEWHTPTYPLLKGTKREELLHKGIIISKKIKPLDLYNYERISFITAMNDLGELSMKL